MYVHKTSQKISGYYIWFVVCLLIWHVSAFSAPQPPLLIDVHESQFKKYLSAYEDYRTSQKHKEKEFPDWEFINSLVLSDSPYLLKHASNPIDWKTWQQASLARADKLNKLIFVSIGFSTCYWCQVMAEESFVDEEIAATLNRDFVAFKIDRETQPDVDDYFTHVLASVKGSAGWPVTAILNEKQEILFIDSYISKPKLLSLLNRFTESQKNNPKLLQGQADLIAKIISLNSKQRSSSEAVNIANLKQPQQSDWQAFDSNLKLELDLKHGGMTGQPKFPSASMLLYLIDKLHFEADPELFLFVDTQLYNMSTRGLYDHINGGFHRYVSDDSWSVPHYEKMLYTQGLLLEVYSRAYRIMPSQYLEEVVQDTILFLQTFLISEHNTYYSALDAVYKNKEGGFYLYSEKELAEHRLLLNDNSNFSLYRKEQEQGVSFGFHVKRPYSEKFHLLKKALNSNRSKELLYVDEKILTSWNALMISGFSQAYLSFGKQVYRELALKLGDAIWQNQISEGELLRVSLKGKAGNTKATLDDYAWLIRGYLDLHDISEDNKWVNRAIILLEQVSELAYKPGIGFTVTHVRNINIGGVNFDDGELINPQAVMLDNIQRVHARLGNARFSDVLQDTITQLLKPMSNTNIEQFYARKTFRKQQWLFDPVQYFAQGNGRAALKQQADCSYVLDIHLQPGWHINSNILFDDDFLPTVVKPLEFTNSSDLKQSNDKSFAELPFNVTYPTDEKLYFGPSNKELNVFGNRFPIFLEGHGGFTLNLQACSEPDSLCLFPETLQFHLPKPSCDSVSSN